MNSATKIRLSLGLVGSLVAVTLLAVALLPCGESGQAAAKRWIFFRDKGVRDVGLALMRLRARLPAPVRERWSRVNWPGDECDLPVSSNYKSALHAAGVTVLRESRWLNAVSASLTPEQQEAVLRMPHVRGIRPVAFSSRTPVPADEPQDDVRLPSPTPSHRYNYGTSLRQWEVVQVPALHDRGITGQGVTICITDTGFRKTHEAFRKARIADEWDFVSNDDDTQSEPDDDQDIEFHGTCCWSLLAAMVEGKLIGGAFSAGFLLARTEVLEAETLAEEDDWVAAIEWADERGCDIVSSSLAFMDFYSYPDLDGQTSIASRFAGTAEARGILIVSALGNSGPNPGTLNSPSDAYGILSVGALDGSGITIAGFSSRGPTADGRTKPEVVAQGTAVFVADTNSPRGYSLQAGTSMACPAVASAAALLLSVHRDWTPAQLREALMNTATQAQTPGNIYGWGTVQAVKAAAYLPRDAIEIDHVPLKDQPASAAGYRVTAKIRAYWGVRSDKTYVLYRTAPAGRFARVALRMTADGTYQALLPARPAGSIVSYYLQVTDSKGRTRRRPYEAPAALYQFRVRGAH